MTKYQCCIQIRLIPLSLLISIMDVEIFYLEGRWGIWLMAKNPCVIFQAASQVLTKLYSQAPWGRAAVPIADLVHHQYTAVSEWSCSQGCWHSVQPLSLHTDIPSLVTCIPRSLVWGLRHSIFRSFSRARERNLGGIFLRIQHFSLLVLPFASPRSRVHKAARAFCSSTQIVAQSCPMLSDTMDCGPPGASVNGILQTRILEWVAICSGLPQNIGWPHHVYADPPDLPALSSSMGENTIGGTGVLSFRFWPNTLSLSD